MDLTVRVRRAWVRTRSHTVVFDRDPDFARFSRDPSGEVQGLLQIWVHGWPHADCEYLGSLRLCSGRFHSLEVLRLYRRATGWAQRVGENPTGVRHALGRWLRKCTAVA